MEIRKIRLGSLLLSSNVFMAPLAGYTCYPFRMLAYEMGAGLCFTEMVSANALKYKDRATKRLLFTTEEERVKAVQLLGGIPAVDGADGMQRASGRFRHYRHQYGLPGAQCVQKRRRKCSDAGSETCFCDHPGL